MTNLLEVVPDLDAQAFSHLIPSLERHAISSADLLTLDPVDVAKRAHVPTEEVRKLVDAIFNQLRGVKASPLWISQQNAGPDGCISLLDDDLDCMLNGGIHTGYVTEIAGESAAGKTQCLLTLLLAVQLPPPMGLGKNALYLSTEAQLSTKRLAQILDQHPKLQTEAKPSLSKVYSTHIRDLDAQEHVLRYQVPAMIQRNDIGLVVVDSIAANYRAELIKTSDRRAADSLAQRTLQIGRMGAHLRALAQSTNVAIVLANQVADRFDTIDIATQSSYRSRSPTPPPDNSRQPLLLPRGSHITVSPSIDIPLLTEHQQRFYTGWGDDASVTSLKNPSLGLTWTNQLATRIVLLKTQDHGVKRLTDAMPSDWRRTLKVVFSNWSLASQLPFEIWQGGIRCVHDSSTQEDQS